MALDFEAVSLDVGGVLVVPDHGLVSAALRRVGATFQPERFGIGHYLAMAGVDRAASAPEDFTDYADAFLEAVRVPTGDRPAAHRVLASLLRTPVWSQPVPGARAGLAALAAAGLRLAVTSNSDGGIADHLLRHEWLQVGDGPGIPVEVIVDSGALGVGKPDPRMYAATVAGLGVPAERVVHIGDSVVYDVDGAVVSGLQSVHMDPYELCTSSAHRHVRRLGELLDPW